VRALQENVIKTYPGSRSFQADAIKMAEKGYFPTSQSWKQGEWSGGNYIVAVLLIFVFDLGLLILGYMLIVKPQGALSVTYQLRAPEKTCPSCAERIKSAALVCHFCGHQFTSAEVQAAITQLKVMPKRCIAVLPVSLPVLRSFWLSWAVLRSY